MNKLLCAKMNARIYDCLDRIEFICEDFFDFAQNACSLVRPDVIFLSPPWGGVDYMDKHEEINLNKFPIDGFRIFQSALKLCKNIVYFLPRNCNIENCVDLMSDSFNVIELEQNFLDYKLVAISAYYGDLVNLVKQ